MARQVEPHPHHEPQHDAWSEAWGDRALQNLGRRLVSYGLDEEQAAVVVEQTWLFYSYVALPKLQKRFPMGIATKQTVNEPAVYLYLTFTTLEGPPGPELGAETFQALHQAFTEYLAEPLGDVVKTHLEPFPVSQAWHGYRALQYPADFEFNLMSYAAIHGLDDAGVFVDDLQAELKTLMDPDTAALWLETPNLMFGGRKPAEFLDDPSDRQLRDVITRAKFNIPAT